MIRLSKRLQAIADFVSEGSRVADIGTDHGYVPIYLLQSGKIPSAVAMDVNPGPLARAREHIDACELGAYIETRLSDGLAALKHREADTVVIAGMGGGLMIRILKDGQAKLEGVRELILQPQSEQKDVRMFLRQQGFFICDEQMLVEDGKYYTVIRAVPGTTQHEYTVKNEVMADTFGPVLLQKKHPVLKEWMLREIGIKENILQKLPASGSAQKNDARRREVEEMLCLLRDALWD